MAGWFTTTWPLRIGAGLQVAPSSKEISAARSRTAPAAEPRCRSTHTGTAYVSPLGAVLRASSAGEKRTTETSSGRPSPVRSERNVQAVEARVDGVVRGELRDQACGVRPVQRGEVAGARAAVAAGVHEGQRVRLPLVLHRQRRAHPDVATGGDEVPAEVARRRRGGGGDRDDGLSARGRRHRRRTHRERPRLALALHRQLQRHRDGAVQARALKDEAAWRADGSPATWAYRTEGMKIRLSTRPGKGTLHPVEEDVPAFRLGEKNVTYEQLQTLQTDAEALRKQLAAEVSAWIDEAAEEAKTTTPKATKNEWLVNFDRYVAGRAIDLLYTVPVPDKARAAAYQVLKTTKASPTSAGPRTRWAAPARSSPCPSRSTRSRCSSSSTSWTPRP
ncbi:hypothetical protein AB0C28_54675 [Nonomuraea sp. NPDC048892]|uniref:hypothetical protein n=1 Tax=Nonomuraea sp. NPDC048892 TaxID=3154624 RepID=UPI0033CB97D4